MENLFRKAAIPLSAMVLVGGCVDNYPEASMETPAAALSYSPRNYDLSSAEAKKTLCDTANDTWASAGKALSCEEMTPANLKEIAIKNANGFFGKLKGLLASSKLTPLDSGMSSSQFQPHAFAIDEPSGAHHVLQIFSGEYEALVYLYLNASGDFQKGFDGSEFYSYSLSADSFDFYHFQNGSGPIKTGKPDLSVDDTSDCAVEDNAAMYPDGAYVLKIVANVASQAGSYALNCQALPELTQNFNSVCVDTKSEGSATCSIGEGGKKNQIVEQRAPLIKNSSKSDINDQFLFLQSLVNKLGFKIEPFKK